MSNPVFSPSVFQTQSEYVVNTATMTAQGTIFKTIFLTLLLAATGAVVGMEFVNSGGEAVFGQDPMIILIAGIIIGVIAVFAGMFVPAIAAPASIVYAVAEGAALGIISMFYGMREGMHDLPLLAGALTFATLFGMLILYQLRIIRVTAFFRMAVVGATVGLFLGLGVLWLLSLFGIGGGIIGSLYGNGMIGIGFSLFCVGLAAFNLALDFDFIERGSQSNLPKKYEWVAALGLLVTLVWLYIELLRLLAKLRSE